MIKFDHIGKHFSKGGEVIRALDDVSLEIPKGNVALVYGPSGSGKTTLINLAAGLTRPTSGGVSIAGQALQGLSGRDLTALRARRVALVFQLFHLIPYLTALENVLLPTLASSAIAKGEARSRAEELLTQLGVSHRLAHFPDELSAGERQRCAIARALMNRPEVILADEPTGNLDPESAKHVLAALDTARSNGATVLLVSHQPAETIRPDLTFRLENGTLQG
jgi:putative ABC transport system ATP-binding protein